MARGVILAGLLAALTVRAHVQRDLLQRTMPTPEVIAAQLRGKREWMGFPAYHDRGAWAVLFTPVADHVIQKGETFLEHAWRPITATQYLEFEKTGDRASMQRAFNDNRDAMVALVYAELAEGRGRFVETIADGLWFYTEMTSWAYSAHMHHHKRKAYTSLPDPNEHIIDLSTGDMASFFAWTLHFLGAEIDRVSPLITARMRQTIRDRVMTTYLERSDFSWQAFDATPLTKINNWTPWCNFNVITCFLLLEEDEERLAEAIHRSAVSVDKFINYYNDDGACEEGTSYWNHAVGKLFDYLSILERRGVDVSAIFAEPLLTRMGEFLVDAYIGDGWVVNYSDASPRFAGPTGVIHRYGQAVGSERLQGFAAYLHRRDPKAEYIITPDFFRSLDNLAGYSKLALGSPKFTAPEVAWYRETELLFMRDATGLFLSCKGGTNQQSHNHNDVGSFVLFFQGHPVFIDVGVGTYTRQTFSADRYSLWPMQSSYHNLPRINGAAQVSLGGHRRPDDHLFRAKDVRFDADSRKLSLDIAGSYDRAATVRRWQRTYALPRPGSLEIVDEFELDTASEPNEIIFMTHPEPELVGPGSVRLRTPAGALVLRFNAAAFRLHIESVPLTDGKLRDSWGTQVYRLRLQATTLVKSGRFSYSVDVETEKS